MDPNTNQPTLSGRRSEAERKRSKRRILIGFGILCMLGLVSAVCMQNPQWFVLEEESKITSMYSDRLTSYIFYPTDYDLDVTADEVYMGLDRCLYYKNGNETIGISNGNYAEYGNAVAFFGTYFETVIAGDVETYNTYFTDHYYETNKPYALFAPQMLYNMKIELLSARPQNDGTVIYAFNVEYMIHRNDGTFRNDIESDASKKLYYELIEDKNGVVKIDRITYYV